MINDKNLLKVREKQVRILKALFFFFAFSFSSQTLAEGVDLRIEPKKPIKGQSFSIVFEIESQDTNPPTIAFEPGRLEILGKQNRGTSTVSTYINGRLNTKRTTTIVYEAQAPSAGSYQLRDIKVTIAGKTYGAESKRIQVLSKARTPDRFMVRAEFQKETLYLGEPLYLNYYYYSRINESEIEVLEFPKLNSFLKSSAGVADLKSQVERVDVNGIIYKKRLIYRAKLFPEKVGSLKIDPLKLRVGYREGLSQDPFFGNFGFQTGRAKTQTIRSEKATVEVLPLPSENVPPHFSGLIGVHKFSLNIPKQKYVVNEAIEARLLVEGPGALENYDGPTLFSHPGLEEFETNAEMTVNNKGPSKKTFDYTYLAREGLNLKERSLPIAFFNPKTKSYETIQLKIPSLKVLGSATTASLGLPSDPALKGSPKGTGVVNDSGQEARPIELKVVGPHFGVMKSWVKSYPTWIYVLSFLFIAFQLFPLLKRRRSESDAALLEVFERIKNEGIDYPRLFRVIEELRKRKALEDDLTVREVVEKSGLSAQDCEYFFYLLDVVEGQGYQSDYNQERFQYVAKHFQSLKKELSLT